MGREGSLLGRGSLFSGKNRWISWHLTVSSECVIVRVLSDLWWADRPVLLTYSLAEELAEIVAHAVEHKLRLLVII